MDRVYRIKIERNGISPDRECQRFCPMPSGQQKQGISIPVYNVAGAGKNLPQEDDKSLEKLISLLGHG